MSQTHPEKTFSVQQNARAEEGICGAICKK